MLTYSDQLADSLLSILAVRGGEVVKSIFGNRFTNGPRVRKSGAITGAGNYAVKPPY
jgi:hypothetical protein